MKTNFPIVRREWWVISTCTGTGELMLECALTGSFGVVERPTSEEWAAAFSAPSNPYRWDNVERVVIKREGPEPASLVSDDQLKIEELMRSHERLRAEYNDLAAKHVAMQKLIGEPPEGSHPDEMLPRASTWHAERANWALELDQLRAYARRIEAQLNALRAAS